MFGFKSKQKKLEKALETVEELYGEGDYEAAERELNLAKPLAEEAGDEAAKVVIHNYLAGIYRGTGRMDQALDAATQCAQLAQQNGEPDERLGYLSDNVAQILERLDRPDESITWFTKAIAQLRTAEEPDLGTIFNSMQAIARLHLKQGRTAEAETFLLESLQMAQSAGIIEARIDAGMRLADFYTTLERPTESVRVLTEIRDAMTEAFKQPKNDYAVFNQQAMAFEMMKEEHQEKGTIPLNYQGLLVQLSRANHKIGIDDGMPGNMPKASEFEQKMYAYEPMELAGKIEQVAVALHFLAQETGRPQAFDYAEKYYRQALALIEDGVETYPPAAAMKETLEQNLKELAEDKSKGQGLT